MEHQIKQQVAAASRALYERGGAPATSGNFSARVDGSRVAITASGRHKGRVQAEDILLVDLEGAPLEPLKPSAETLLHTSLYKKYPEIGAVLHIHTVDVTVLTLAHPGLESWTFAGYELLKAFRGIPTHEASMQVPIVDNDQDMVRLSAEVERRLDAIAGLVYGYLIRGHGLYVWGRDLPDALRHVEAFEFLFRCESRMERYQ